MPHHCAFKQNLGAAAAPGGDGMDAVGVVTPLFPPLPVQVVAEEVHCRQQCQILFDGDADAVCFADAAVSPPPRGPQARSSVPKVAQEGGLSALPPDRVTAAGANASRDLTTNNSQKKNRGGLCAR